MNHIEPELNSNNDAFESCINTQKYSKKLDVVKRFNAFTHSLNIVDGKLEKNSVDGYVLVEVDTKKSIEPGSDAYAEDENGLPFLRVADYNKPVLMHWSLISIMWLPMPRKVAVTLKAVI